MKCKDPQQQGLFLIRCLLWGYCNLWCRRRGCTRTPRSFDLSKIRENLGKICENLRKILVNLGISLKIQAKMAPSVRRITWKWHLEVIPKKSLHNPWGRKYPHKKLPENFSAKFREIRAKSILPPKMCLLLHIWLQLLNTEVYLIYMKSNKNGKGSSDGQPRVFPWPQ